MDMTAQRISPGSTNQRNLDPWLSVSLGRCPFIQGCGRPGVGFILLHSILFKKNLHWGRRRSGLAFPPRTAAGAALRRISKDKIKQGLFAEPEAVMVQYRNY